MQPAPHHAADNADWVPARGFDRVEMQRLVFVKWSLHEGYAQFSEDVTSDAQVVDSCGELESASGEGQG